MPQATLTLTYQEGSETIAFAEVYTGDTKIGGDYAIPGAAVNKEVDITLHNALYQLILISCDKQVTIKTNSTGAPADTIVLPANKAAILRTGAVLQGALTAAVTKLYVTNPDAGAATLKIRSMQNLMI